jgi:TATA-binding protein-associated factor Taf7
VICTRNCCNIFICLDPDEDSEGEEDDDDDDEEDDDDDDDDEDDEEEEVILFTNFIQCNRLTDLQVMTEEQKMEEGKRMFSIFAARMFEQRVLIAYREKVGNLSFPSF